MESRACGEAGNGSEPMINESFDKPAAITAQGWYLMDQGKVLEREFSFNSFQEAFGFMTQVALIAENLNHHPDWHNVYHLVTIKLTTHDVDGLSKTDLKMARKINEAYEAYGHPL